LLGFPNKDKDGKIKHNPEREMISDMDSLPWVADVYKRDLQIEKYFIGYLLHPYISMYTGRGCPAQCTFCLWPQTIGGHKYLRPLAAKRRRRNGLHEETVPAGAGIFL